jgi:hypothetical protein
MLFYFEGDKNVSISEHDAWDHAVLKIEYVFWSDTKSDSGMIIDKKNTLRTSHSLFLIL